MKKIAKLVIGLSVLTMLMVCMTAVSFAGTAEDRVTVSVMAGEPVSFCFINMHMPVTGDQFEKAYPDLAALDTVDGVSVADVIVAAHQEKYGADALNHMGFNSGDWGLAVAKQFDSTKVGMYYDNKVSTTGVGAAKAEDGDSIYIGTYKSDSFSDLFGFFEEDYVSSEPGSEFALGLAADNWGAEVIPYEASVKLVDLTTGELKDIEGFTYDPTTGKTIGKIDKKGVYPVVAVGKVKYDGYYGEAEGEIMGPFTLITIGSSATVRFGAAIPGSVDFAEGMKDAYGFIMDGEIQVNGSIAEAFFPEIAEYECEGVSFADALVQAHIEKYGAAKVKEYLNLAYNAGWGIVTVNKQFGHDICGYYYADNKETNGVSIQEIKDGQSLFAGSYADDSYGDLYGYFNKTSVSTTTGKSVSLTVTTGVSLGGQYQSIVPLDKAEVMTIDSKGALKAVSGAAYKKGEENGKVTFKFSKAGTYYVTVNGQKATQDYSGNPITVGCAGPFCKVTVKDATPAKPVIKTAKRNSKVKGTVTWKKATNAKKYEVAYKAKGAKKWTTKTTAKLKVTLKLKAKKAYQVKVRSINGSAKSAYSKVRTIKAK